MRPALAFARWPSPWTSCRDHEPALGSIKRYKLKAENLRVGKVAVNHPSTLAQRTRARPVGASSEPGRQIARILDL